MVHFLQQSGLWLDHPIASSARPRLWANRAEATGKVKSDVPETEDDIEVDDTIDDEDDDSTFIAEDEEDDEDVTDIIGDVSGDEET